MSRRLIHATWISLSAAIVATLLLTQPSTTTAQAAADTPLLDAVTRDWRNDAAWYDGKAEMAVYEASRTIYGEKRAFTAKIYTNKEVADPNTKTKSADNKGRMVFKHHSRDDIGTENYTYHYSTMAYVGVDDLKSLKIDMGSQEDCGATFKQIVNHAGELNWSQFSYFPNEGHREGRYKPSSSLVYHDALSLVLRGYPFDKPHAMTMDLLPDQTTTKWSSTDPVKATVEFVASETLELPIGKTAAFHLTVTPEGGEAEHYWFAADGSAPMLHVMVQYTGPNGQSYRLKEQRRWAYWEH